MQVFIIGTPIETAKAIDTKPIGSATRMRLKNYPMRRINASGVPYGGIFHADEAQTIHESAGKVHAMGGIGQK